jgi:hypothetical protein
MLITEEDTIPKWGRSYVGDLGSLYQFFCKPKTVLRNEVYFLKRREILKEFPILMN